MPKFVGIDYGLMRVGLAVSDPDGKLAFPLQTLELSSCATRKNLLDSLALIIRNNGAAAVVIGLPLNADGSENLACRQIRNMAVRLGRRIDLPIHFIDEYLTSQLAENDLRDCGVRGSKLKQVLDQQAACRILESFLNSLPAHPDGDA